MSKMSALAASRVAACTAVWLILGAAVQPLPAQKAAQRRLQQGRPAKTATSLPADTKVLPDIEYARVGRTSLKLDLYLPPKGDRPVPVIVWIHGGAWQAGDKKPCQFARATSLGYAVASINYRLTDEAVFPAQIHDCKAAIRWIRANAKKYGFDPDHIGVAGGSAGGHLVALLGTTGDMKELEGDVGGNLRYSSKVQAVADFCGPTAFTGEITLPQEHKREHPALVKLFGGPLREHADLARLASPAAHASKDDPPFLIVHGDQDNTVPVNQAHFFDEKLTAAGVEHKLFIVKGGGHGVLNPETIRMALALFDKHLKNSAANKPELPETLPHE
jgi:acetyl esterase/lipase